MSNVRRALRQAMTVARRDFVATVFTPTFLIFLLSPMLTIAFGTVGGLGAQSVARGTIARERLVVIVPPDQAAAVTLADKQLRVAFGGRRLAPIEIQSPTADPAAQARALVSGRNGDVDAALYGPLAKPVIVYEDDSLGYADYLGVLADQVLRAQKSGITTPLSAPTKTVITRTVPTAAGHSTAALFAVLAIFMFTLFLAGLTMGTMAEERSNKVIEVLAAAVPLESVFFGKLIGMFGVALLFVGFWGTVATQISSVLPAGMAAALTSSVPAVGKAAFALLFLAYFVMSYLLVGAVYLILGAQASTQRELQMMALPMTIVQMANLGLAFAAASQPGTTIALIAEIFPLSSPMAMAARAANQADLWPHALAIVWQLLWVTLVISLGARWFRRGVLKSGSGPRRRRSQPASV